jgi:hypothetical protein
LPCSPEDPPSSWLTTLWNPPSIGRTGQGKATISTDPRKVAVNRVWRKERCEGLKYVLRRGGMAEGEKALRVENVLD